MTLGFYFPVNSAIWLSFSPKSIISFRASSFVWPIFYGSYF